MHLRSFRNTLYFYIAVLSLLSLNGCPYSFTGASVPEHWKSIAVPLFDDASGYGQPSLREDITNALIEKIQQDNSLRLADEKAASVTINGTVASVIADKPVTVSQGTQATQFQIDITVEAVLYDNVKNKQVWKKSVSAFGVYPAGGIAERETGIREAVDKLSDDLLLEIISQW